VKLADFVDTRMGEVAM